MKKLMLLAGLLLGCLFMSQAQTIKVGPPAGPKFTFRGGVSNLATTQGTDMIPTATSVYNYANGYLAGSPILITSIANDQVLKWDAANTRWINGTGGGGGTPGGSTTQIQYNSSGAFAGSAGNIWDNTAKMQTITAGLASTNTVTDRLTLSTNSTGTPAVGLGTSIAFQAESSTSEDTDAGRIGVKWNTVTHASRTSTMDFSVYNSGSIGNILSLGLGVATFTGNVSMTGKAIVSTLGTLPNTLVGRNVSQELASVSMGSGITLSSGTLTTSANYNLGTSNGTTCMVKAAGPASSMTFARDAGTGTITITVPANVVVQSVRLFTAAASAYGTTVDVTLDYTGNTTTNQGFSTAEVPTIQGLNLTTSGSNNHYRTAGNASSSILNSMVFAVASGDLTLRFSNYSTVLGTSDTMLIMTF